MHFNFPLPKTCYNKIPTKNEPSDDIIHDP